MLLKYDDTDLLSKLARKHADQCIADCDSARMSAVDLISEYKDHFDPSCPQSEFNNRVLSDDIEKRVSYFEGVLEELEQYQGAGSTITCNNKTYGVAIRKNSSDQTEYIVFDSHGKTQITQSPNAFAFVTTNKKEAAQLLEQLAEFIEYQVDPSLRQMIVEDMQQQGLDTSSQEAENVIQQKMQNMQIKDPNQNTVLCSFFVSPKK